MGTIKVKPWGKDQGDHVTINEEDFDPEVHVPLDAEAKPKGRGKGKAKADPGDKGPEGDDTQAGGDAS